MAGGEEPNSHPATHPMRFDATRRNDQCETDHQTSPLLVQHSQLSFRCPPRCILRRLFHLVKPVTRQRGAPKRGPSLQSSTTIELLMPLLQDREAFSIFLLGHLAARIAFGKHRLT